MKKKSSAQLMKESSENLRKHRDMHNRKVTEKLDTFVYWTSLAILAVFNFIACLFLIPFLMFFEGLRLYLAVGIFGLVFGFLFNLLMLGLEHLKQRHTIVAGIFIPALAVLDIAIIMTIAENLNNAFRAPLTYNVPEVIIIFIVLFLVPYLVALGTGMHRL